MKQFLVLRSWFLVMLEYRMRFWDAGEPNGDWSAVQKVMVGV